jgi:hypothetical protein
MEILDAKSSLDNVIKKSRVHFYKPIQIAEILYRNRLGNLDLSLLENYRTQSKRWRDDVSLLLVGSVSTSSSKFQDNIFDDNAVPPKHIEVLGNFNKENNGIVEAYIYKSMSTKMNDVSIIHDYLSKTNAENFQLDNLINLFSDNAGLRRSMDKVYEIIAYSLFSSVIEALEVFVSVEIGSIDTKLLEDFSDFTSKVVGIQDGLQKREPARVFRVGATNANDGGLDLWANYGPAIQVKHFSINSGHLASITSAVQADKFIVVCTDADQEIIKSVLLQAGSYPKVQSIITLSDLNQWFRRCLNPDYSRSIGKSLLRLMLNEFEFEFPSNLELPSFIQQRGYDEMMLPVGWDTKLLSE